MRLPILNDYVDARTCTDCGGACCRAMPGSAMPEDFGAPDLDVIRVRVMDALATGRWTVDWWEGDVGGLDELDRVPYLRPAVMGSEGRRKDPGRSGRCTFHSDEGCTIFDSRPAGCRGLEPARPSGCRVRHSGKEACALAWRPYADLVWSCARGH